MNIDYMEMSNKKFVAFQKRVALVELLIDDCYSIIEKNKERKKYQRNLGVCNKTINNWVKRYKQNGPEGLRFEKNKIQNDHFDPYLGNRIKEIVNKTIVITVPEIRKILESDISYRDVIINFSNRSIYRYLEMHKLSIKDRKKRLFPNEVESIEPGDYRMIKQMLRIIQCKANSSPKCK
jgi:transposase